MTYEESFNRHLDRAPVPKGCTTRSEYRLLVDRARTWQDDSATLGWDVTDAFELSTSSTTDDCLTSVIGAALAAAADQHTSEGDALVHKIMASRNTWIHARKKQE